MKRTVFAFAVATLALAFASATQAAPVAPLPAGVSAAQGKLTQVQYWRYRRWHHRHCWWGPYHRWHCRYW